MILSWWVDNCVITCWDHLMEKSWDDRWPLMEKYWEMTANRIIEDAFVGQSYRMWLHVWTGNWNEFGNCHVWIIEFHWAIWVVFLDSWGHGKWLADIVRIDVPLFGWMAKVCQYHWEMEGFAYCYSGIFWRHNVTSQVQMLFQNSSETKHWNWLSGDFGRSLSTSCTGLAPQMVWEYPVISSSVRAQGGQRGWWLWPDAWARPSWHRPCHCPHGDAHDQRGSKGPCCAVILVG